MKSGLFTKPKLKPEIASLVDQLSRDVFWLRNKFGVSYENIDEEIMTDEVSVGTQPRTVADICQVDLEKRDYLLMLLMHEIVVQNRFYSSRIGRYVRWIHRTLRGVRAKKLPDKQHYGSY